MSRRAREDADTGDAAAPGAVMTLRFDVALFELRLAKSRAQASQAIADGHALLNGERVKPSRDVRAGDRITLAFGAEPRTLEIVALPTRSLSKDAAKACVRDVG